MAEDRSSEEGHIKDALGKCGYPAWAMVKVKNRREHPKDKKERDSKGQVTIPYVKGTSEAISRIFKKHGVDTAMRPVNTLRESLVHPKDKVESSEAGGVVYEIPCLNCESKYIGETGRLLKTR